MRSERRKFVILLILLAASVALMLYVRGLFGQDFVQHP